MIAFFLSFLVVVAEEVILKTHGPVTLGVFPAIGVDIPPVCRRLLLLAGVLLACLVAADTMVGMGFTTSRDPLGPVAAGDAGVFFGAAHISRDYRRWRWWLLACLFLSFIETTKDG